jgi:glycosyltransferase involved in cell wall biosynthesis
VKVLHVETGRHLYGGARQVLYLLKGLAALGVENTLVCARDSAVAEPAQAHGTVREVVVRGDHDTTFIRSLRGEIRRARPDLVHLHSRRGADVLGAIAARLERVPVVLSRRVDNPEPRWAVPLKYRLYDRVIAISKAIRDVLVGCGVATDKLRIVPSAVNCAEFEGPRDTVWLRSEFGLGPDEQYVGIVAQLIPRKGHADLFAAWPAVLAAQPAARLLIFGRGPLREDLEARAAGLGIAGSLRFAGFRDDLHRILPCLDLVVHPAHREGLGVAVLQAACAGVPVVATATGGLREIIADGVNGRMVPVSDTDMLAEAVVSMLRDRRSARQMAAAAALTVRTRFSVDAMVAGNLSVYRELLPEV